jgi:hypothetical protein
MRGTVISKIHMLWVMIIIKSLKDMESDLNESRNFSGKERCFISHALVDVKIVE